MADTVLSCNIVVLVADTEIAQGKSGEKGVERASEAAEFGGSFLLVYFLFSPTQSKSYGPGWFVLRTYFIFNSHLLGACY